MVSVKVTFFFYIGNSSLLLCYNVTQERLWNEWEVGSAHAGPVYEIASDQPKRKGCSPCEMIEWISLVRKKHTNREPKFSYIHVYPKILNNTLHFVTGNILLRDDDSSLIFALCQWNSSLGRKISSISCLTSLKKKIYTSAFVSVI